MSAKKLHKMLKKGCKGFLCSVLETKGTELELEEILIVCEFHNVFLDDLSNVLIEEDIEFGIDLLSRTHCNAHNILIIV